MIIFQRKVDIYFVLTIPLYLFVGNTPLHECVKHKMVSCIVALLKKGSDVNHMNAAGYGPLHLAVRAGEGFSMEVLRALVVNGYNTDVNIPDSQGNAEVSLL